MAEITAEDAKKTRKPYALKQDHLNQVRQLITTLNLELDNNGNWKVKADITVTNQSDQS